MNNNHGSTIVLSLVFLGIILTTAATFTLISISNYKQSVSIDDAFTSYYKAEIGVERGAYYFRKLSDDDLSDNTPVGCGVSDCLLEIQPIDNFSRPLLKKDESFQLDIYNLSEIVSTVRYLRASWNSAANPLTRLQISYTGWQGSSFGATQKRIIISNTQVDLSTACLGACDFYRIRFKALFGDASNVLITAQATAAGPNLAIPGLSQVKAIAEYGHSRQASGIITSHLAPLSGLYDYAIFSEEDVGKSYCGNNIVEGSEQCDNGSQCQNGANCTKDNDCLGIGDGKCLPRDLGAGDYCNAKCECKNPTTCN